MRWLRIGAQARARLATPLEVSIVRVRELARRAAAGYEMPHPRELDGSGDLGHTVDVRMSGGTAYTTSLRVPIILIVIGLALTVFGARLVLVAVRGVRGKPTPTVD